MCVLTFHYNDAPSAHPRFLIQLEPMSMTQLTYFIGDPQDLNFEKYEYKLKSIVL